MSPILRSAVLPIVLFAPSLACGPGRETADPKSPAAVSCEGQSRPQLDCSSEFKYDDRMVKGGFSVLNVGANLETEVKALREVDQETAKYVAQSRRLCEEYNKCIIDKETYATRAENLRRRIAKVPELLDSVAHAKSGSERAKAVSLAYQALVPDEQRTELSLDFTVLAQRPSDQAPVPIQPGASLPTNSRVSFTVRTTRDAHVYLFQRSPKGEISVLFPNEGIELKNPLPAGKALRIPSGEATFRLNEQDIGEERVFLAASLTPIPSLQKALGEVGAGQNRVAVLETLTTIPAGGTGPGTCTRALELDKGPGCVRSRGLVLDSPKELRGLSMKMQTEAADTSIVGVFNFQHTR